MKREGEILNQWGESAPYWKKHRQIIKQMFAPITEALMKDAQIMNGHHVLDIATGPGEPALSIAEAIGAGGQVFGIDPVQEMIAAARSAAIRGGFTNAHFEIASADRLPFPADTFDAVVSRFGVMFFASPVDGVREMLRVLKPGRRLAMAVWHFADRNPFHYLVSRVLERYVESPPAPADAPDAFRFALHDKLRDVVVEAGGAEASERLLQFNIEAPLSVEDFWTLRSEMSEKLRGKLAILSADQVKELRREVIEGLRSYATVRGVRFPAEVLIVSGTRK